MKSALAAVMLLLFAAGAASAQPMGQWTRVGEIDDGSVFYIQASSSPDPSLVRIWERVEFAQVNEYGERSALNVVDYNCPRRTMRTAETTGYRGPNLTLPNQTDRNASNWANIEPGSIAESQYNIVCGGGGGK